MDSLLCKTESLCAVCEHNVEGVCALESTLDAFLMQAAPELESMSVAPLALA
jgi:hypothetical protein